METMKGGEGYVGIGIALLVVGLEKHSDISTSLSHYELQAHVQVLKVDLTMAFCHHQRGIHSFLMRLIAGVSFRYRIARLKFFGKIVLSH